jgi:hypothetical protein
LKLNAKDFEKLGFPKHLLEGKKIYIGKFLSNSGVFFFIESREIAIGFMCHEISRALSADVNCQKIDAAYILPPDITIAPAKMPCFLLTTPDSIKVISYDEPKLFDEIMKTANANAAGVKFVYGEIEEDSKKESE